LLIVSSAFVLYLYLLGRAVTPQLPADGDRFERMAVRVASGILVNFSLVLCGLALDRVITIGALIGAAALVHSLVATRRRQSARQESAGRAVVVTAIGLLVLLACYFLILDEPISRWDARSVWFFHAKMIWVANALRLSSGFGDPTIAFSSPAYPHLVPALAAQLAALKGLWNEFIPKTALLVMLVPVTAWIASLRTPRLSYLTLLLLAVAFDGWLSNGYMDAYLILYAGLAVLFVGRHLAGGGDLNLYSGLAAAGIALGIKNEGMLFGACLAAAVVCTPAGRAGIARTIRRLPRDRQLPAALVTALLPTVLWTIEKNLWAIKSELTGDSAAASSRIASRLADGRTPQFVLDYLIVQSPAIWIPIALTIALAVFCRWQRIRIHPGAVLAATTALFYFVGIYAAYLSTPISLEFHLATSATRTTAGVRMALMVAIYFMLTTLERASDIGAAHARLPAPLDRRESEGAALTSADRTAPVLVH
jgi:hypothetical protein